MAPEKFVKLGESCVLHVGGLRLRSVRMMWGLISVTIVVAGALLRELRATAKDPELRSKEMSLLGRGRCVVMLGMLMVSKLG